MLLYYSLLYLAPALLFASVIIPAAWRRAEWWFLDFLAIPLPGALWMLLLDEGVRPKSFSNLLAELLSLAAVLGALLIVRAWLGTRAPRAVASAVFMAAGLTAAAALFLLVPVIPD